MNLNEIYINNYNSNRIFKTIYKYVKENTCNNRRFRRRL